MASLRVAVFSYNRGDYLAHCVASVRRNMSWADLHIYDDNSTDPSTLRVLAGLGLPVHRPDVDHHAPRGGLYRNMQQALQDATTDLIFFLQDDMQIVRPVDAEDLSRIAALFAAVPDRAFVCPVFMKGLRRKRHQRRLTADPALRAYVTPPDAPAAQKGSIYSDVSIGQVARLKAAEWQFQASEAQCAQAAAALFADMPYLADPFAFYCPEVPVFRNRAQTWAGRLALTVSGDEVKALRDLTEDEAQAFRRRSLTQWPIAEDFLRPVNPKVRRPFVYKDVKVRWWINLLYWLETRIRR